MISVKNLDKEIIGIRIDLIYILILNYGPKHVIDPIKILQAKVKNVWKLFLKNVVLDNTHDFLDSLFISKIYTR